MSSGLALLLNVKFGACDIMRRVKFSDTWAAGPTRCPRQHRTPTLPGRVQLTRNRLQVNVLRAIKPLSREDVRRHVVRAQYRSGTLHDEAIPA